MSRSFCRVVLASVVALSLSIATGPAVQAAPREASITRSWVEEAKEWLSRLLDGREPEKTKKLTASVGPGGYATSGPCIDPLGRPKPCP